jgi:SpoVK/Ycf46/Vps4 family AAA+-type ATPase
MSSIREFIYIINHTDLFLGKGIKSNRSMLLFGKPGTGKTQVARYISSGTGLLLVTVRLDCVISSYSGSTPKNIGVLFDFVQRTPCILFLDEFDAIAKVRDDSNELGDLKRVVNTLLQNIDSIESGIPIIAATNHEHLLDPAVWRRFDYKIRMKLPDAATRGMMFAEFLKDVPIEKGVPDYNHLSRNPHAFVQGMNAKLLWATIPYKCRHETALRGSRS